MLEALMHGDSTFITLTYSEEKLPKNGTLVKEHYQKFLKKLRKRLSPRHLRYFLVGEYGELSQRPHYHAALFGHSLLEPEIVSESWGLGHVHVGDLTIHSAQYIAGYVTKKLTTPDDDNNREFRLKKNMLLDGRLPEFARMSLKPGIGALAMSQISDKLLGYLPDDDVPASLSYGKKQLPLGRYLRNKLRENYGMEKKLPKEKYEQWAMQMLELHETYVEAQGYKTPYKKVIVDLKAQEALELVERTKIFTKKGVL